jgi:hypothetical protein
VQGVVPLSSFTGRVTPVDIDPRFAFTVHVESAVPAVSNFTEGAVVTLTIHSPSLLFADAPTKGKAYDFVLHRKIQKGKAKFFGLRVRKVDQTGRPRYNPKLAASIKPVSSSENVNNGRDTDGKAE